MDIPAECGTPESSATLLDLFAAREARASRRLDGETYVLEAGIEMAEWLHHIRIDFDPEATDGQVEDLWGQVEALTRRWSKASGIATLVTAVDEKRIEGRRS